MVVIPRPEGKPISTLHHVTTRLRRRIKGSSTIKIGQIKPVTPHEGNFHGTHLDGHEDCLNDFINAFIGMKSGTFVDVGVTMGQILLKLRSFDEERKYIGFEVSASCCESMNQIIVQNNIKNIIVVPLGLSECRGAIRLHSSALSDPQATLIGDFWTEANQRKFERLVYVEAGDTILQVAAGGQVGVIKFDVEGEELEVLRGLRDTLARDQPIIVMERRAACCLQLEALLQAAGHPCFRRATKSWRR